MKKKKIAVFVSMITVASMLLSLGAMAAKPDTAGAAGAAKKAASIVTKAANANARQQFVQSINAQNSIRKQIRAVVVQISKDLAGTAKVSSITSTQDYKDVMTALNSAKTALKGNMNHSIWQQYKGARDKTAALSAAMQQISANTDTLNSVLSSLKAVLPKADSIASQKQAIVSAAETFKASAEAKKTTIDANHQTIAGLNDANTKLINQIVATVSANSSLLASNPDAMTAITNTLTQVSTALKAEYDGKVADAQKAYDQYRQNGQYDQALAELDTIISIQNNRITVLKDVQTQLTTALGDLNAIVSASATTSGTSSQAA